MKKLFLSLSILAQVVFSMEREEIELDTKCADEECHQPVEQAISPSHTLPNFEAYSFIECLKPGEVLFSITTEEGLNVSNEFKDFFTVCYQAERYGDAYYFVPENMKEDAEKALALSSKTSPSFYAYLIPILDSDKFKTLASKTASGCSSKEGKWFNSVNWKGLERVYAEGYTMLEESRVRYAQVAPVQDSTQHSEWSCGPNSGFRAMRLLGLTLEDYEYWALAEGCPKSLSRQDLINPGVRVAAISGILGIFLTPFTGGISLIVGAIGVGVGSATAATGAYAPIEVGPRPHILAAYLTENPKMQKEKMRAYFHGFSDLDYEINIVCEIREEKPVIALLINGTTKMHYVTIIGMKPQGEHISEVVILDTDGEIGTMSQSDLRFRMDRDGYAGLLLNAKYSIIKFHVPIDLSAYYATGRRVYDEAGLARACKIAGARLTQADNEKIDRMIF